MQNVRLILEYDGTDYSGFAPQANAKSIHACLARAVSATTGEEVQMAVAGRTDAGVHARGQVVTFRTATRIPLQRLPAAINSRLPMDITVVTAEAVPDRFHARFSAVAKTYSYTIWNDRTPAPLWRRHALFEPRQLDVPAMQAAAEILIGRQDFRAFRATGGAAKTSVRTLRRLDVVRVPAFADECFPPAQPAPTGREGGQLLRVVAEADGFLYNMVRILVGTLIEVGCGRRTSDDIAAALATGDRTRAGWTVPPHGLCLEWVHYPPMAEFS